MVDTFPFEKRNAVFKDGIELFINSKIGGAENELQKLFSNSDTLQEIPRLIILDHAECIFTAFSNDSIEIKSSIIPHDQMSLERKIFLSAKSSIDRLNRDSRQAVFFIALCVDKNNLPAEIRRPGRLNNSFNVNISKSEQRAEILRNFLGSWKFPNSELKEECVKIISGQPTSGFTSADLQSLLQMTWQVKTGEFVTIDDFLNARHFVNPSSIVARVSKLQLPITEIVGLDKELESIQQYMSAIFRNDCTVPLPRGILLEGPSGCGKSLLAAQLSKLPFKITGVDKSKTFPVNFISIDSSQIISKYFGQSDKNLAQIFSEARQAAPCILFFDQIDTLVGRRGNNNESFDRLVTTFLVEMDGLKSKLDISQENRTVIVLGATNKKSSIDPAILRPGRLDLHVNIPLPTSSIRHEFIKKFLGKALDETGTSRYRLQDEDIAVLLNQTEGNSFADLDSIFKEAALNALREDINCTGVDFRHFNLKIN